MLDAREKGGLGLSTKDVGMIYGVVGVVGLTIGGIIGGIVAARGGLKKWLWPMMLSMLLTVVTFVYLAYFLPTSRFEINLCVFIEQFGYGFGFTAYMLFLMYFSKGKYKTAHYAICTGIMALGMMLPGMAAGWIQEQLGYRHFFLWVLGCSLVPILAAKLLKIAESDGR
jgi:PAT family beta-lactamase induction signal transducer AmpG